MHNMTTSIVLDLIYASYKECTLQLVIHHVWMDEIRILCVAMQKYGFINLN